MPFIFANGAVVSKSQQVENSNCTSGEFCKLIGYWTFDGGDVPNGLIKDMSATTTPSHGNTVSISTTTFYTAGKIGQALNFDGVDDGVNIGVIPTLYASSSDMTVSAWIKPSKFVVGFQCIICNSNAALANVPWAMEFSVVASRFSFGQAGIGSGTVRVNNNTNLKKDVWYHVVAVRSFSSSLVWPTTLYLNGVADGSGTLGRAGQSNQTVAIGKYGAGSTGYFQGAIDDVRVYNRALSADEIKQMYNSGISKFASSKPINATTTCFYSLSCGLIGYWTFDGGDISNGRVLDKSGGINHANLINISTTTFYTAGKIGQGFNFDGVDDKVSIDQFNSALSIGSTFTISAWFKSKSFSTANDRPTILGSSVSTSDRTYLQVSSTGEPIVATWNGSSMTSKSGNSVKLDTWHHIVMTNNGTTINGYIDNTLMSGNTLANTSFSNGKTNIGAGPAFGFFPGVIDDVRIYNRVLSSSEITALFNSGNSKFATSPNVISTQSCFAGLNCGLVGYWTFDGKDMNNGLVVDKSDNKKNGNLINISTTTFYTSGKIGQALNFDGVDDYINFNNVSSGLKTISFWIKANDLNRNIMLINATTNSIEVSNGAITATNFSSPNIYINSVSGSTITANKWYHVVITESSGVTGSLVQIGKIGSGYFSGLIDDVRFYNRVLTPTEIKQLYYLGR